MFTRCLLFPNKNILPEYLFFNYTTGNFSETTDGQDTFLLFFCLFFLRGSVHVNHIVLSPLSTRINETEFIFTYSRL